MAIAIPVPQISISPAPPQESLDEPFSPFPWATPDADDSFRPKHLTPPPATAKFVRQLSPLRPADAPGKGKGLEPERFEALLKASRERNAMVGAKRTDLRKEVALKAHKSKQVERRALFLSKFAAPPSPTATTLPKTPPESPAIFHYTLPSPGLVSPLALFDSLNSDKSGSGPLSYPREPWVEQVDFRMPSPPKNSDIPPARATTVHEPKPPKSLPSLDQISARLQSQGHPTIQFLDSAPRSNRLPAFLTQAHAPVANERPTLSVGRLQLPINSKRASLPVQSSAPLPKSPNLSVGPVIQVTTIRVPRTRRMSSLDLSESNLMALNSREKTAKDMLSTLRRRIPIEEEPPVDDRKWRRHSAPADLSPGKPRSGFEHPVLLLPGGF
ncbi:hypothetical protein BDZ89DRAFT_460549 [Hymenopellis radicata]|nr:hypothetical protein BDZ89DRAFT_460549 [Hymenopellis radicata]